MSGGRERKRKEKWKWGSKELEEMQEFKYLDFNLDRKGDYKRHIKEISRKGKMIAKKYGGLRGKAMQK